MSATPVNAGVEDNVGLSVIASVIGAYNDVASAHTLFGAINGLSHSISGLSSAITEVSSKIDLQATSIKSKIDAQTTTLSNKIANSASSAPASASLPTGSAGTEFSVGGYTFMIVANSGSQVRCAYKGCVGGAWLNQSDAVNAAKSYSAPCAALNNVYDVVGQGLITYSEAAALPVSKRKELYNAAGNPFWTESTAYDSDYYWYVDSSGELYNCYYDTSWRCVPVFTIKKR